MWATMRSTHMIIPQDELPAATMRVPKSMKRYPRRFDIHSHGEGLFVPQGHEVELPQNIQIPVMPIEMMTRALMTLFQRTLFSPPMVQNVMAGSCCTGRLYISGTTLPP